jgi:hypothetical protein
MSTTNAYITLVQSPTEDNAHLDHIASSTPSWGRNFVLQSRWLEDMPIRWQETKLRVSTFVEINLGMLLILLAQFFFVCMNLGVKQLDSREVPVHTLEVRAFV